MRSANETPGDFAIARSHSPSSLICDLIRQVKPDKRGAIQLTNAIQRLCEDSRPVLAVKLPPGENRYDNGPCPRYFETFGEFALADPAIGRRLEELPAKK